MARAPAVQLRPDDNLAVACRALKPGERIAAAGREIGLREAVALGHKLSLEDIPAGAAIRKYGQVIGFASRDIPGGSHIHLHNCSAERFERDYAFSSEVPPAPRAERPRTFRGYVRPDGRAGTRNYIAVISTVNCSASTSKYITARFPREALKDYPNVDGLIPLTHKGGCAMQYDGPDHHQLNRVLAGFARHPNVGAYLLVGLGCETGQASHLIRSERLVEIEGVTPPGGGLGKPPPVITIQEAGGIARTVEAGVRALAEMLPQVNDVERRELPASLLVLGTECGGSDGSSGVTANPALGIASDLLVAQGGTAILSETPEIYGAEHLLTRRAVSREVGEALVERIRWWEWYTGIFGAEINNNPSPGNKEGGLTTIYEKSLGAIAKGGSTALVAVYRYAEPVTAKGFVVMDTPGYDPVSMTGMVAGGANVCVFTTGRGSVYGCKPAPCIKVSTNTPLFERLRDDMDLDAGVIFDGVAVEEVGRRIFEEILAVAGGKKTKSELQDIGEEEFAPWSVGPVL
jgi:altronate hydrolase